MNIYPKLSTFITELSFTEVALERRQEWQPVIAYLNTKLSAQEPVALTFVCTHNSRRSQLAQILAQVMAEYYGFRTVQTYSAGTEVTALYPVIAESLEAVGFSVNTVSEGQNPVYIFRYAPSHTGIKAFSKTLTHVHNPQQNFVAIMTCDQAEEACPVVSGAEARFALTFVDPKRADKLPNQKAVYAETTRQIASELKYVFSTVNQML